MWRSLKIITIFAAAAASAQEIDKVAWFAGCWQFQGGSVTVEEQWMNPSGGAMLGVGRTVRNGKMVFHEFMSITVDNGVLVYTATIRRNMTPFKLLRGGSDEVVFENPQHDYPQRVIYRKQPDGLFARIEGVEKGQAKGTDFRMRRVACP